MLSRQGGPLTVDSVIIDTLIIGEVDQADRVEGAFLSSRRLVDARGDDERERQEGPGRNHSGDCTDSTGELPDGQGDLPGTCHRRSGSDESVLLSG